MAKAIIGIDTGLNGAIAVIAHDLVSVYDVPTLEIKNGRRNKNIVNKIVLIRIFRQIINELSDYADIVVYIEKTGSMPKQGVASMFSMGKTYGNLEMLPYVCGKDLPVIEITPQAWKKEMMSGMGKEKSASCYKASTMFPTLEFFGPKGGAKDGRADAILIAEYGRRKETGKNV